MQNSPAAKAGVQGSDIILAIDNQSFTSVQEVKQYISDHKGNILQFKIQRFKEIKTVDVRSVVQPPPDSGPTGIRLR